ncbi:MAG: peptide-methionine (S)-S-oxide reductase MsrA [Pelagibacteraceae bacterium]|jgi:peptide-methionine (S)-S-oxide reductase
MSKAVFGAGCFWGVEKKFSELKGVTKTEVGYSQGINEKTSYEEVCQGNTNHVEVVLVEYDENILTYENLVHFFYKIHDPTTPNQQGPDRGIQYRSLIGVFNDDQKKKATDIVEDLNREQFNQKITTTIEDVNNYCTAEEYHQKYIEKKYSFLNI